MEHHERDIIKPRTATEQILLNVFCELLDISTDHVSIFDSFWIVGGDSIMLVSFASRAKREGIILTPRDMFEQPTIAALAENVDKRAQSRD